MDNIVNLIANQEFEQAKILLEKIVIKDKENKEALKNLGLCYLNLEEYEPAIKVFSRLIKLDREDAGAFFYLANCEEKIGEIEKSILYYKKVIRLREEFFDAYKNLCVLYITQGEFEKARNIAAKGAKKSPFDYQFQYFIATTLMAEGKTKDAIKYLEKALELNPNHQQLLNNLGSCYLASGKLEHAKEIFESAYDLNSQDALTNYNLGILFQAKEEYERALNYLDEAYKIQPTIMILTSLAQCAMYGEKFALAAKLYSNLVALHPEKLNFKKNLLNCLIETREVNRAIVVAQGIIKLNPKAEDVQLKLAFLYRLSGQYYKAIVILEELIRKGRIEADIYYEHGLNALRLDDIDVAKNSFKKVIQLEPDNALAHKDLGMVYLYMNLVEWAQDEIKIALELESDNHYINFAYATFLNKTNNFTLADEYYKKALEKNKSADYLTYYAQNLAILGQDAVPVLKQALEIDAQFPLARLELAKIYFSKRKYEIAKKLLEDIFEADDEIINLGAKIEMKLKNFETAQKLFKKLLENYPKNHLLLTDLAQCALEMGDLESAKNYASKALEIFSDFPDALKILKELNNE